MVAWHKENVKTLEYKINLMNIKKHLMVRLKSLMGDILADSLVSSELYTTQSEKTYLNNYGIFIEDRRPQ